MALLRLDAIPGIVEATSRFKGDSFVKDRDGDKQLWRGILLQKSYMGGEVTMTGVIRGPRAEVGPFFLGPGC